MLIKSEFQPNKLLATNKANAQHSEIKTRLALAKKTHSLHLNQLNIDIILPEVFTLTKLTRLDLSFNNIVKLSPRIGDMANLQQLWLNDNPLREIPIEISKCHKLRELDLKNTFIITLPRELANLSSLLFLNLDECPMKDSLKTVYGGGMVSMHTDLRRKEDRKLFKEKVFDTLTEWIYPSQPKEQVFEQIERLFANLKDCNTEMLKKLQRNCQMLFPVKFSDIDPEIIRQRLFKLYEEGVAREDIAQIELRLKSHFLDEPLETIVTLATDIYYTTAKHDQNTVDVRTYLKTQQEFFKYKSHIFNAPLGELTAMKLLENLAAYKAFKKQERIDIIARLKQQIDSLYADESNVINDDFSEIKEEKLVEYTDGLVRELKRTSLIAAFGKQLRGYMPKYNELKHFNPQRISAAFIADIALAQQEAAQTQVGYGATGRSVRKSNSTMRMSTIGGTTSMGAGGTLSGTINLTRH